MTINEARKILGKEANGMNDTDVLREVESATVLKDVFFKLYIDGIKKKSKTNDLPIKVKGVQ